MQENVLFYLYDSTPPVTRVFCIIIISIISLTCVNIIDGQHLMISKEILYDEILNYKNILKAAKLSKILNPQNNTSNVFNYGKNLGKLINFISKYNFFDNFYSHFYFFRRILQKLVLAPFYYGKPNVEALFHFIFFYRYSSMLEESYVFISDYLFVIFLCFILMLNIATFLKDFQSLGPSFSCILTYIWTRRNPRAIIQTYGFFTFHAFYLPFFIPIFTYVTDGSVGSEEVMGIFIGHIIFFLKDVFPVYGSDFLRTPCFLHRFFGEVQDCCTGKKVVSRFKNIPRVEYNNTPINYSISYTDDENIPGMNGFSDAERNTDGFGANLSFNNDEE